MDPLERRTSPVRVERLAAEPSPEVTADERMARCREIRQLVFVDEQSVPPELEWDGLDALAEHFIAYQAIESGPASPAREQIVGTARLRRLDGYAKAERVAVLASHRQHGVGRCLMDALEQRAIEWGLATIELSAQVRVVPFYERLGYARHGEIFVQAGIEHLAMSKTLS